MSVTFAKGFSAAGIAAGISSVEGKKDLALVVNQGPRGSRDADHGIAPLIEALRLRIFAGRYDRAQHRVGRVGE